MSRSFEDKLARECALKSISRADVLAAVGTISKDTVNRWFNGKAIPDLKESLLIARLLGVPLEYLADDDIEEAQAAEVPPPQNDPLTLLTAAFFVLEKLDSAITPGGIDQCRTRLKLGIISMVRRY